MVVDSSDDLIEFEFMESLESEREFDVEPFVLVVLVDMLLAIDPSSSDSWLEVLCAGLCAGGIRYFCRSFFCLGFLCLYLFLILFLMRGEGTCCVGLVLEH